jgi:hypothetical protein
MFVIYGLVIMALGFLIVLKSEWMLRNFGQIAWFDRYLRLDGGSRLGYGLIGAFIIIIGFIVLTNMFGDMMTWLVSPLTKYNK